MNPLSALYGAALGIRNSLYDRGSLTIRKLRGPVVSIGNIVVGGAGKTPFLIMLGGLLKERGIAFDVLSRGYGRSTKGVGLVDTAGSPVEFGDEPLLIARKLQAPVIVGEDRHAAGLFAEEKFGPQLHLLDDGFQHRRLAREFDIVLVTPTDANDSLLPVGRMREPLSSLSRADAVVVTNDTGSGFSLTNQDVWRVRRWIVTAGITERCFAFCGIARPEGFFQQLSESGITLAGTRSFRDHHLYTASDVHRLLELYKRNGAAAFVTTEKDAINLGQHVVGLQPIHVVPVQMEMEDAKQALDHLLNSIRTIPRQREKIEGSV